MNFKKITDEYLLEHNYDLAEIEVVDRVRSWITHEIRDVENVLLQSLIGCESPVEQSLAIAIELNYLYLFNRFNPKIDILSVVNQKQIDVDGKNYRVDFYIPVSYKRKQGKDKIVKFVIEVDGHEFHQKTKEQVERDNQRTRELQIAGFEVVRFSGTEVYNKPYNCTDSLIKIILSKLDE